MEISVCAVAAVLATYAALLSSWNFFAARRDGRKKGKLAESAAPSPVHTAVQNSPVPDSPVQAAPRRDELKLRILQSGRFTVSAGHGDGTKQALLLIHLQAEVCNHRPTESALTIRSAKLDGVDVLEDQSSMWLGIQRRPAMDQKIVVGPDGAQYFTVTLALLTAQPASAVHEQAQGTIVFEDTFLGDLPAVEFKANKNQA